MDESETTTKTLRDSKLYLANLKENYLSFLVPNVQTMIMFEEEIDKNYPRKDSEADHTRVFLYYANVKGNSNITQLTDTQRLDRPFDIDQFVNDFFASVNEGSPSERASLLVFRPTLLAAMNQSLINILELSDYKVTPNEKAVSINVLLTLVSVLLNDPLDAFIIIRDKPDDNGNVQSNIDFVWTVKSRD